MQLISEPVRDRAPADTSIVYGGWMYSSPFSDALKYQVGRHLIDTQVSKCFNTAPKG